MSLSPDKKAALRKQAAAYVRPALSSLAALPEREWRYFEQRLRPELLGRGEALTRAGEVADRLGFVVSGLVRKVHVTERGRSVVRGFGWAGSIVGAYASLLT